MVFAVFAQLIVAFIVVAVSLFFSSSAAWSAAIGSGVAFLPNAVFAVYLVFSPTVAVHRFFVGEGIKILIAIVAAIFVWREFGSQIQPLAFWAGFILVLKAHSFGLLGTVNK